MSLSLSLPSLLGKRVARRQRSTRSDGGRGGDAIAARSTAMIEALEERTFFSAAPAVATAPITTPVLKTQTATFAAKIAKNGTTTILPLKITGVQVQNGQLMALGQLGNQAFTAPITVSASPNAADPTCPILNLHLGPIHLDVLGLVVDTSPICLDVTAVPGSGNLLGNLLCDVANLLNAGTPLGTILGGLTGAQLDQLLGGITGLLNGLLGNLTSPTAVTGVTTAATPAGATNILHLSLGPVNLNLLGLDVALDNCSGGPVTVDITAQPGPGNLLGNLLNGVAHLLDNPSNPNALANLLGRVGQIIGGLLGGVA